MARPRWLSGIRKADAIALSPTHSLFAADPSHFGPYSPSSRLFLNPLFADPTLVFGAMHVAVHSGQLSTIRRALGKPPVV